MQNWEYLLTNYPSIYEMLNAGFTFTQMTKELNKILDSQITYRQLLYLTEKVQSRRIHSEYNKIVMIEDINGSMDTEFNKYCVNFKGLLITYKSALKLTDRKHIIAPDNFINISSKESLLYAKRLLKLYYLSDISLLKKHKLIYPDQPDIDLNALQEQINSHFNYEFNNALLNLREKYFHFLTTKIKEKINEK